MEAEAREILSTMGESVERLAAAASMLEKTVSWMEERQAALSGDVQKIVATVEQTAEQKLEQSKRELELETKLAEAQEQIAQLQAQAGRLTSQRKTLPAATVQLLAKQGIDSLEQVEAGALDAALTGLSLEQRIAVKSQLMRAGSMV